MVKATKILLTTPFSGEPKLTDFTFVEEELPSIKDNEILVEALYLSVDPYMRPYMINFPIGSLMIGGQVGKVLESKNPKYPRNTIVFGQFGWRTHTIVNIAKTTSGDIYPLPKLGNLPVSIGVGVVGMPGNTAYFGFLDICQPKAGETVVVTAAGGAVGSLVGQIAKIKGCNVIGFAGTDQKCEWLVKELGFDYALNYKKDNIAAELKAVAPKGVDCYFDNVGGELSSIIISQMNDKGRISVCGAISSYNDDAANLPKATLLQTYFVSKHLKMEGFTASQWASRWHEGLEAMSKWVIEGKIKYEETVTDGFNNMPQAFIDMLRGKNTGKAVVKV